MFRSLSSQSSREVHVTAAMAASDLPVNAVEALDGFVTAEPTPKPESRRGWRRRRIKRGKS